MKKPKIYGKYPPEIVFAVNFLQLLVCAAGAYVMFVLHWITGILYVAFILFMEFQVYREGCRYCVYYGGGCAFGKGAVAALFFRKGNPKKFCEKEVSGKDFLPYLLIPLIPLVVGIALLVSRGFDWLVLIAAVYPTFSSIFLNPIIYGRMACPHCKQGKKCCPALKFFQKKAKR